MSIDLKCQEKDLLNYDLRNYNGFDVDFQMSREKVKNRVPDLSFSN